VHCYSDKCFEITALVETEPSQTAASLAEYLLSKIISSIVKSCPRAEGKKRNKNQNNMLC